MPKFDTLPLAEALQRTAKTPGVANEYAHFIRSVGAGQAGRLVLKPGETPRGVKVRLTRAAKLVPVTLTVNQVGEDIYFWPKDAVARRRGGRPRKVAQSV